MTLGQPYLAEDGDTVWDTNEAAQYPRRIIERSDGSALVVMRGVVVVEALRASTDAATATPAAVTLLLDGLNNERHNGKIAVLLAHRARWLSVNDDITAASLAGNIRAWKYANPHLAHLARSPRVAADYPNAAALSTLQSEGPQTAPTTVAGAASLWGWTLRAQG